MAGYNLNLTGETISEPSSGFDPLPPGKYAVSVYDAEAGEFGPNGVNGGRPNLQVQFRVSDGQAGANRRIFQTVGLFPSWAPKEKGDTPKDNFTFYQFFAAVQGKDEKEFRAEVKEAAESKKGNLTLPDAEDLLGREVELTLGIENDVYAFNKAREDDPDVVQDDFKRNSVKNIKAIGKAQAKAKSEVHRL